MQLQPLSVIKATDLNAFLQEVLLFPAMKPDDPNKNSDGAPQES